MDLTQLDAVGFDKLLGVEYVELSGDRVVATCPVRADLHQPFGILHGGVHCALVESTASLGATLWYGGGLDGAKGSVVGVANHTNFLRPVTEGTLTITATPLQRGRTQQLWRVVVTRDDGKEVALGEVRLANLPARTAPA